MPDYQFNTNLGPTAQQGTSLGDLINTARGAQAYQQQQQLNPIQLEKAQQELEQARVGTEKAKFGFSGEKYDKAAKIAGASATDKILAEKIANGDSNGIIDYFHGKMGELKKAGFSDAEALGAVAKFVDLAHSSPQHIIPALENLSTQVISPEAQVGLQTGEVASNAAGNLVRVNKSRGTVSPIAQVGANLNPTTADVSLGNEYSKGLQGRVQASNDWLQRSTEMRGILDEFKPGAGSTTYAQLAQKLQAIGAPDDLVNKVGNGDLAATQSLQKFMAASIMSAARQSAEGSPFASEVKNFEANNPSVNSDPKTLKRFIEFYDRLAGTSIKENEALAQAKEKGIYNPGTWQADWQRIGQQEGLLPKTPSGKVGEKPQSEKTVVREGTLNGRRVVQYSDGTIGYK